MIDPVAIRSYLASQSQGNLGGGGRGGIQAMLANLRQQLYGPQALQQFGGGQNPGVGKPAWQQLREAGIGGQGSAAANQAALRQLQGGGQPAQPDQMRGQASPAEQQMLNDYVRTAVGVGPLQSVTGGGLQAPTGTAMDPGFVGSVADPFTPDALGNLRANTTGMTPEEVQAQLGGGPGVPLPTQTAQPLPEIMTIPSGAPAGVAGAVGPALRGAPKPGASAPPQAAAANVGQAAQQAKPTRTAVPPAVNPAVLGAQDFRGPNARRIVQARQGIYNNVRQALRKPAGGR